MYFDVSTIVFLYLTVYDLLFTMPQLQPLRSQRGKNGAPVSSAEGVRQKSPPPQLLAEALQGIGVCDGSYPGGQNYSVCRGQPSFSILLGAWGPGSFTEDLEAALRCHCYPGNPRFCFNRYS